MDWPHWFLLLTAPMCFYAAFSDLKFLRIPNRLVLLMLAAYLLSAPFVLPLGDAALRLGIGLGALVIGVLLHSTGRVGGGDIKMFAAVLPFVATTDLASFAVLLALTTFAGLIVHKTMARTGLAPPDWASWQRARVYPFGLSLGTGLLIYLGIRAFIEPL
jgi:prepilin peptidase CpaA